MNAEDGFDERDREIDELLKGGGAPEGSGSPAGASREGGELEDLLGDPSAGRSGRGRRDPGTRTGPREAAPPAPDSRAGDGADGRTISGGPDQGDGREAADSRRPGIKVPFNYSALVGVLLAFIAIFILVNALRNTESGTVGIGPVGIGEKVEPFAVPLATSDLEGDANIDPDQACRVAGADVLRICDFFGRPLLMSFWFTGGASECIDQQDVFDEVATRFRKRMAAVSINVRDDRERVRELVEQRGWKVPVGHDTDGAVSNIYRVGGCPTFLFVNPDGVLEQAEIGRTTVDELGSQVRSFLDGQEETEKAGQTTTGG